MNIVSFQTEFEGGLAKANGIDGLIGFIRRDDVWHQRMFEVLAEHIGPALEEFDLEFEDLSELLGGFCQTDSNSSPQGQRRCPLSRAK